MAEYSKEMVRAIEAKWQDRWREWQTYRTAIDHDKPKYYVLDMFPYPSGAGLHVGHPLGYIASDIVARYRRLKGFNVLHPMGFDAFGLPAEQYAIEHGIDPSVSTANNIDVFKWQLDKIGFCYDWSRELRTCDPKYYKWTQWIFLHFFDSWFNRLSQQAERIETLARTFDEEGNQRHPFPDDTFTLDSKKTFDAAFWKSRSAEEREDILMQYRLAYIAFTDVNWCEALGTVLANDEVINGVSYRGGFPVVKKQMRQWNLRITEYSERLLKGLEEVDFSESIKEIQRNWIGRSVGALITFPLRAADKPDQTLEIFTTRPDTLFGADFIVLAPEHPLVAKVTTEAQAAAVQTYLKYVESRSEVDRRSEVKKVTGCFTGAMAIHSLTKHEIPVWIGEYVLASYGTGAIMAVPCCDDRDHKFAKHFHIPITNISGDAYTGEMAVESKDIILQNSDFATGLSVTQASEKIIAALQTQGMGREKVMYKMHDAGWSRQRYWGEPFPVIFKNDIPYAIPFEELPLTLPSTRNFLPSGTGEGPLANLKDWVYAVPGQRRDTNTMPTHAGAAWYFLRFMDPHNTEAFASPESLAYWNQVDVYIGGAEHAVAHLLYARLWVKLLHDLGYLSFDEPFKKLINQGKIMGESRFVYRTRGDRHLFISHGLKDQYETDPLRVDVTMVDGHILDTEAFKRWKPDFAEAKFILEDGKYVCGGSVEKMSKSYYNVINPDDVIDQYGADALRLYEMFLGPLEQSKPWSIQGIDGVVKFLRKVWRLAHDNGDFHVTETEPTAGEWKALHKAIKKINHDIEHFSFNTCVSEFMICANELSTLKCNKRKIIEPFMILLAPFAPHLAEEIWEKLGHTQTIFNAAYPTHQEVYLTEEEYEYPISINGKVRTKILFSLQASVADIERKVLENEAVKKWCEGKTPKKMIVIPGKIVNIVV